MPTTTDSQARRREDRRADRVRALAFVLREEFGIPFRLFEAEIGDPAMAFDVEEAQSIPAVSRDEVRRLAGRSRPLR